jgi:putative endonuclease
MVRCVDGSLYTGIAKDVRVRMEKHNSGKGAAYTRSHRPVQLLYQENRFTRSQALIREAQIKRFPRPKKESLIRPRKMNRDSPVDTGRSSIGRGTEFSSPPGRKGSVN